MAANPAKITVSRLTDPGNEDLPSAPTPEERLDLLERLRMEAGKFAYEYPTRLRRVIEVVGKA